MKTKTINMDEDEAAMYEWAICDEDEISDKDESWRQDAAMVGIDIADALRE